MSDQTNMITSEENVMSDQTNMITLADLTIRYLKLMEIEYVFGIPGGAIAPLYDALARSERQGPKWPRAVVARHETGAAFMADGYARETGKIGVCCSTTGPGATNLITGVASAYVNHIPLLVITAQTRLSHFGKGAFQESSPDGVDTHGMFEQCTRYNSIVSHPDQFEGKLVDALIAALTPPGGPVHLSVPIDIFNSLVADRIQFTNLKQFLGESSLVDMNAINRLDEKIVEVLTQHQQVVLLIGGECGHAVKEVVKFAELINAPMVTTPEGKSWLDSYHPLYYGVFGFAGHRSARRLLAEKNVGLILAVGTSLGEWSTDGWDTLLMNDKLVHIHHSSEYFARSYMACLHVSGKFSTIFEILIQRLNTLIHTKKLIQHPKQVENVLDPLYSSSQHSSPQRCAPHHIEIDFPHKYQEDSKSSPMHVKPQRLMCELTTHFPPETRFLADTGNSFAWTTHYLFHHAESCYRIAMEFGSMGWAVGAAVGTALAAPGKPVVCVTGDGSFLMSGQEITVAVAEQLPVIFVILNDQALGMVKHGQQLTGAEAVGFKLPPVDFAMMAQAMGAESYAIRTPKDFRKINYQEICCRKGPTLLDVHIDPKEIPPMGMRVRTLKKSASVVKKKVRVLKKELAMAD